MPIDREVAAIPEKEKLKSIIKIILRVTKSKKKEINKKTKASIEENCIIFFPLNLVNKELFTNIPIPKVKRYKLSIREPMVTGTFRFLK
ncbi:unnamed protein product [marine sediment metagenome]|uniref:Uncharacterized protein n=2 Tax=marine sediment metagenome TaxID=412755 RepID=X1PGB8_9ZZZZ